MMQNELLKRMWLLAGCVCVLAVRLQAADDAAPWETKYAGDAAVGAQVLGLWQFDDPDELVDASGQGNALKLRGGGRIVEGGRFGSCLESFTADVKNDKGQGAEVKNCPALNPTGAFTAEAWVKPKAELATHPTSFILDKKYYHYAKDIPQANTGYCWYLTRSGKKFIMRVSLGFGGDSAWFKSTPVELKTDEWRHLAFTYDGAGTVHFFLDGKSAGRGFSEDRGGITPSKYPLVLGDRVGSVHTGFPGFLDQVRITQGILPVLRGSLEIQPGFCRTVYRRMEKDASIVVEIFNDTGRILNDITITASLGVDTRNVEIPTLASGDAHTVNLPVNTSLRAGEYSLKVTARATDGARILEVENVLPVIIVPRPTPNQMPVVMWGGGDNETLKDIGFTHSLKHMTDYARIWKAGEPTDAQNSDQSTSTARMLDQALADGLGACLYIYPGRWVQRNKKLSKYLRVDADGKPYSHENTAAAFPELKTFSYNCGASVAKTFGQFPALSAALVHSEIRDGTQISYHDYEKELCKKELGFDIPLEATGKGGVQYNTIAGFPADRVIPDDYKLLRFYKWFWKSGDGWNDLHTQTSRGLHSTGRDDLFTFFDPAVRVPSVWGSGGSVDVISQWTYSYPDPLKIGQATDELFAMAKGQPGQKVMKMTQIIWYRNGTAPKLPKDEKDYAPWEKKLPDAKFVTISPDHLREAFWSKMSRPIRGIMYHGWGSLVESTHGSYRFTNPATRPVLTELIKTVIHPLGPTLLQVPDRPADVAVLESFASQIFASRGTRGWSGSWEADMHLVLQWAGLQPEILYDETVVRDGLDQYKVLVMPFCDVLPESVAERVRAFQRNGGLIVADEALCPAIVPDILVKSIKRSGEAREQKERLQAAATKLRAELDPFYTRYGESDQADIVSRFRRRGNTDYLFAINDKRTYGDYVGHHRKVMEKGLPNTGSLTVRRGEGFVYDLVKHKAVQAERVNGTLRFDADFGPGDGRLFMITSVPITGVTCKTPRSVKRGKRAKITIRVKANGRLDAVVPVQVQVSDDAGREAEGTGYYGAVAGKLTLHLDIAPNDKPGQWRVQVTELASGTQATSNLTVR